MSGLDPDAPVPDVPSTARLAWLLFMQPFKLREMCAAWGLDIDQSLWILRGQIRRDGRVREVVRKLMSLPVLWGPLAGVGLWLALGAAAPVEEVLMVLMFGLGMGISMGSAASVGGTVVAVAYAVAYGALGGFDATLMAAGVGRSDSFALGLVLAVTLNVVTGRLAGRTAFRLLELGTSAVVVFMALVFTKDLWVMAVAFLAFWLFVTRLPIFVVEALLTEYVATVARHPERGPRAVLWLPYRHHDLIRFPLPGLRRALFDLAEHSPNLARQLIDEASTTIAQKGPAQRAFDHLQARALWQAAEAGAWLRVIELRGNFFPAREALAPDDILVSFIAAATDLHAAETGGSQHRRRNLLDRASKQIDDLKKAYLGAATHDRRSTLLHDVAGAWAQIIAARREALAREIERDPEIPNVFVVGPPLDPRDPEALQLFRARRDLITIIERDLDDTQRGAIFLVGQRRMGKTSLLAMLPTYFGTATTIATCDFQGLSGSEHGRAPHRWVVERLAEELARIPGLALPDAGVTDAWGSALAWLTAVDAELARVDHRALVAIDEVERLQDAVLEGWGSLTFLDFVRAAGDRLRRIRLLLVSAHPLAHPKLGRAWVDRLISVLPRTLGPLDLDDAEALLCRPVPTFPPGVFDEEIAREIVTQTGRHPFLIQAVGREVVQRLLRDRRRVASALDVERALDGVVKIAESALFTYLWDSFDPAERDVMRTLAGGAVVDPETGTFRVLREQWFVDVHDGAPVVAVPLLGRWIRDYRNVRAAAPNDAPTLAL